MRQQSERDKTQDYYLGWYIDTPGKIKERIETLKLKFTGEFTDKELNQLPGL